MSKHSGLTEPWNGRGIHPDERPTTAQQDWEDGRQVIHGEDGHTGFRCYECAQVSGVRVMIHPTSGDWWQTKQIEWQEQCDLIHTAFQEAVAAHFPDHQPFNCDSCPEKPVMPPKPIMPVERALQRD